MKKFMIILFLFIISYSLNATTYHPITIDGTNDFTVANELFNTSSTSWYDYFTWDVNNLYYGVGATDIDLDGKVMMIYIDIDPKENPTQGTGSTSGGSWGGISPTLPFTANYWFSYKNGYWNLRKYDSGWQIDQSYNGSVATDTDFKEVSIPLSDIGSPSQIYIVMFVQNDDGSWTWSAAPSTDFTDGSGNKTFSHFFGYTLTSGINPNSGYEDNTLPVELSTFTAQYLAGKPLLYWTTQSETDNMGWFVYRNQVEDFTSATKVSGMIEGHGTTTQAQSYVYEDVIAHPQVDDVYYYWLESIDYSGTIHHFDKVAMITIPDINNPNPNITPPQVYDLISSPNPFTETTNIKFMLTQTAFVDVAIYNVKGALVKSFATQHVTAEDEVSLQWDGKDAQGKSLSSGIYLYSVKVNGQDYATKQVILMK